jgi:hypothetical protein
VCATVLMDGCGWGWGSSGGWEGLVRNGEGCTVAGMVVQCLQVGRESIADILCYLHLDLTRANELMIGGSWCKSETNPHAG